ncbi:hypothetical protein ANOM_000478 [Aspergillus nomiae NRRL 13137]|uniref:HTH CENPB-type domain-containing protein n=1 Tax=Aspergillus nomiae NRRL (strain ATCC 15546 / NRRL 13137 / CBS 260.88 / M93) TaxID=1509407 RepID=A0A0L1JIY9_ASPN3|nr:uncharacterized protein ANOM_000478 [Aspergillus nomiae NRRL 13137]KNG91358.1 hypothetical protein ANOM_000478 [Aspergillus nomiae NRRL 13137]
MLIGHPHQEISPKSSDRVNRITPRPLKTDPQDATQERAILATEIRPYRPQSRLSTQHTGLSVVIPVKPEISKKKKKDGGKRTNESISVEVVNEAPLRAVEIASQALHLQEAGKWDDLDNELQSEEEEAQSNEEQPASKDVLPPDPSLLNETRVAQARAAYEPSMLKRRAKGPRLPRREAAHPLQKLDATDEDSIGKEALRRVEQDDRRPTNVLIWEVANDLYREKCVQLGMKFQPIGSQWSQRFLIRHPDFRKTWSQLIDARKPPPRAPPPGASSGPHSWHFAEDASSIVDDDFSKFHIPKTEAECATYFRQIRSGPPATAVRIQRFLTHLLVEQAKSVDMLSRVRKALEEPKETNETAPQVATREPQKGSEQAQGFFAPPASQSQQPPTAIASTPIVGTTVGDFTAAPSQSSQASQLPTDNIPQHQEPQVPSNPPPRANLHSDGRAAMARQTSSTSLPPPTNRLAQTQPSQEALNTASSTPILSNASSTYTSTPSQSITTFQQFSRNHMSQPSHRSDQQEAHEAQQPQSTADSTPVIGNASGSITTPLPLSMEPFKSSSAQDPSLPLYDLQSPQTQESRRDEPTADSNPILSNASPTHPSETLQSTQSSFQPLTASIPQLLHHPEPQEAQESQNPEDTATSLSLLSNAPSSNPPASLESLLSSFQAYPTTHVRQSPQKPQKPKKPSQPRKPQQPRARNQQTQSQRPQQSQQPQQQQSPLSQQQSRQLPQPSEPPQPVQPPESSQVPGRSSNHMASTMVPFTGWGSGALSMTSSSPYHSGNFATSFGGSQPGRPQYYPNEYLLRTAVDQSPKRRRIDDPINSINHPGFQ